METMTQNTLADLRSMEHAAEDKKDRNLLGLCTLFVATIEDAKDRISQLELVFCSQLFPAFQAKLLESRQAFQHAEYLHHQAIQEWESTREDLLRDIHMLRADKENVTVRSKLSSEIDVLHQELQGLRLEKQQQAEETSHCKLQLEEQAMLHKQLSIEIEELQQELLRLQNQKDLQDQDDLCRSSNKKDGVALLPSSKGTLQREFDKLSEEAAELRQHNIQLLQENQDINQHCTKLASEVGHSKLKVLSFSSEVSPTVAEMDKTLQLKLEQKSQERGLECFRRQLISAEVEKEKRATHAAHVKLHTLKKRYQSLRKQYTVLFRHSHLLEHQKCATHVIACENQEKFDLADERYSNTRVLLKIGELNVADVDELKAKCNSTKSRTSIPTPSSSKVKNTRYECEYAPNLVHEEKPGHVSVMDSPKQVFEEPKLTNTIIPQKEAINVAMVESPERSDSSQSPDGTEKRGFGENGEVEKEDQVLNTPEKMNNLDSSLLTEKFLKPKKKALPRKPYAHLDKSSQVGHCNGFYLKDDLKFGVNADEIAERTESCNSGDNSLDGRFVKSPLPSEGMQGNMIEGTGLQRPADNGWCPIQKRASSSKCQLKASKSRKTTWRNTRSRAEVYGFDPHDDFLNTPHENALKSHVDQAVNENQVNIALCQSGAGADISESKDIQKPSHKQEQLADCGRKDVSFSQITTQAPDQEGNFTHCANQGEKCVNEQVGFHQSLGSRDKLMRPPKKHGPYAQDLGDDSKNKDPAMSKRKVAPPVSKQGPMYKYVEPVRKKDEREKLQGVECNQCKKFYDAVLSNNGPGATTARCEHHDVTSRHRYRYLPPSTPEGFWNIGFDSEL